jgi:hypothetical protein
MLRHDFKSANVGVSGNFLAFKKRLECFIAAAMAKR